MESKFEVILSDLDGVIRHFPPERDAKIEMDCQLPVGTLAKTAFEKQLLMNVVTGKITDEQWRSEILNRLCSNFPIENCKRAILSWSNFEGNFDAETTEFLKSVASQSTFALLTNATSRLRSDLEKVGYWNKFDRIFNSSEIGFAKPAKEIYFHVCKQLKTKPKDVLFIDDSISHVNAAREIGIQALHFTSLAKLRDDMSAL